MTTPQRVLQIKVTLREVRPPIWRRLLVRDSVSLQLLHEILQVAMGWTNSHMHQFMQGRTYYGPPDRESPHVRDESKVRLADVLQKPKQRILYEYDFGDGWLHDIVLEKIVDPEPGRKYPWVLAGKRACPPEDCGGVPGYYGLLRALKNPEDRLSREILELIDPFDPEAFQVYERNEAFHGGWAPNRRSP